MLLCLFIFDEMMSSNKPNNESEVPSLEDLLVALSTTARNTGQRDIELRNTLNVMLAREVIDGVPRGDYVRLAILLAFKRRNHSNAQVGGDGDGERGFLRAVFLELYDLSQEDEEKSFLAGLVNVVLPLVPQFGSWRDLLVLGEASFPKMENDEDESPLCLPPLGQAVGRAFATQLRRDMELVVANDNLPEKEKYIPSNACKYAPHEKRHTGNTTVKPGVERPTKSKKTQRANRIQKCLADEVASLVLTKDDQVKDGKNSRLRADYRKFLSKLKAILTEKGFVIEPLLCKRKLHAINFNKANKKALAKNRKCLEKDPEIKRKWHQAMMSSNKAVSDIDSLLEVSSQITEELTTVEDKSDRISSLRIMKCISEIRQGRHELKENAEKLLEQVASNETEEVDSCFLLESMRTSVLPVVDSSACETVTEFVSLILAAFITARAQGLTQVIVDGEVLRLPVIPPPADLQHATTASQRRALETAQREAEALATSIFFESVCNTASAVLSRDESAFTNDEIDLHNMNHVRQSNYIDRLHVNATASLNAHNGCNDIADLKMTDSEINVPVDIMYLTTCDMAREVSNGDEYRNLIETELRNSKSHIRTFSLCRVSEELQGDGVISPVDFVLRNVPPNPIPAELSIDLCLVMDLTASMGSWMAASKMHLANILASLKKETQVGKIRVSFLGYRDWEDTGRLVCHDFVDIGSVEDNLLPLMRHQMPSGGGDMEEDVLIAYHAALTNITWESDVRIMLHVADAPAHGYGDRGDRFKDGRCPDQKAPHLSLKETLTRLADNKKVDLLFCRVDSYGSVNAKMERMFSDVYNDGPGFGVLPMSYGASKFKDAILSTLSSSLLQAMAPADVAGLQSFSGGTASSLQRVFNSSLRESIGGVKAKLSENDEESDIVGIEGVTCTMADDEDEDEEDYGLSAKKSLSVPKASRNNFERLMDELEAEELQPVRLALGMTIKQSMHENAAEVLLASGVSVQDLIDMNYPEEIIHLMKNVAMQKLSQL